MNTEETSRLIAEYGRDIYNFCLHLTMSKNEADDLYQDVFLKVMDKVSDSGNPKSFLMGSALRLWQNKRRKAAWRHRLVPQDDLSEDLSTAVTPESEYLIKEEKKTVLKAVNSLKEPLRTVILLYYSADLSIDEIAKIMGVPEGTVKSRLYKARKVLKEKLEADING